MNIPETTAEELVMSHNTLELPTSLFSALLRMTALTHPNNNKLIVEAAIMSMVPLLDYVEEAYDLEAAAVMDTVMNALDEAAGIAYARKAAKQ